MKQFSNVRGTDISVPTLHVNVDTVYIRSNIQRIESDEFTGWEYDEIQYTKDEYLSYLANRDEIQSLEFKLLSADERYKQLNKSNILLEDLKKAKIAQLDYLCTQTILGRFSCTLNENTYEFSYDAEAQLRFTGIGVLFLSNKITEIEWTAYLNGERVRIILDNNSFDNVSQSALIHQNSNVVRYNQILQQVLSAQTTEEVDAIIW